MVELFHITSEKCSRVVTENYSTSFCSAIRLLHKNLRAAIFNVYGFVRLADEIVDSFHEHDKAQLLSQFKAETYEAIDRGISLNPILNSFQRTVKEFNIHPGLIEDFFESMESDLCKRTYDRQEFNKYIYGSAEVVGLMCLYVFCHGNREHYQRLEYSARALGAAFQKVNFLRDMKMDYQELSRVYFPACDFTNFTQEEKTQIEQEIEDDFRKAYIGILQLPDEARFGVYVAYKYYYSLFQKIRKMEPARVLATRIRIPNYRKIWILLRAGVKNRLRLIGQ